MKTRICSHKAAFLQDRLSFLLQLFLLLTTASAFLGPNLLSVSIPLIGALFPFRVLLPVTALLYVLWAAKGHDAPWKDSTALEKWVYVLIGVMLVCGALSLPRAIDPGFTFRKLFNLCFDLCFFFLLLRLCRNREVFRRVIAVAVVCMAVLCVLGVWETFFGGIFNDFYDIYVEHAWLNRYLQFPVVTFGNTNDYASMLLFVTALFLVARGLGIFGGENRAVKYGPLLLLPPVYFLLTMCSSRINLLAFWILLACTLVHDLLRRDLPKWMPAVTVALILAVSFCHRYRDIVVPVQNYLEQAQEVTFEGLLHALEEGTTDSAKGPSLQDQFFEQDANGTVSIRKTGSAGERLLLLLHAADCFAESRGLGVGLGNTEVLAAQRTVVPEWEGERTNSIHCFIARIGADYGIFVLIPLCAIVFLLLRRIWEVFWNGCRKKGRTAIACGLLLFGCTVIYPLVSTAPSDAQDNLAMWLYLAGMVAVSSVFCRRA